jgi:hypothetical protein
MEEMTEDTPFPSFAVGVFTKLVLGAAYCMLHPVESSC